MALDVEDIVGKAGWKDTETDPKKIKGYVRPELLAYSKKTFDYAAAVAPDVFDKKEDDAKKLVQAMAKAAAPTTVGGPWKTAELPFTDLTLIFGSNPLGTSPGTVVPFDDAAIYLGLMHETKKVMDGYAATSKAAKEAKKLGYTAYSVDAKKEYDDIIKGCKADRSADKTQLAVQLESTVAFNNAVKKFEENSEKWAEEWDKVSPKSTQRLIDGRIATVIATLETAINQGKAKSPNYEKTLAQLTRDYEAALTNHDITKGSALEAAVKFKIHEEIDKKKAAKVAAFTTNWKSADKDAFGEDLKNMMEKSVIQSALTITPATGTEPTKIGDEDKKSKKGNTATRVVGAVAAGAAAVGAWQLLTSKAAPTVNPQTGQQEEGQKPLWKKIIGCVLLAAIPIAAFAALNPTGTHELLGKASKAMGGGGKGV